VTSEIDPVDNLPAWKGRRVVTRLQKERATKRARRFVLVEWGELVTAFGALGFGRAQRLFFVVLLHQNLKWVAANSGWVELAHADLAAVGLADSNLTKAVAKLETLGLVEVQRRPGKRPLLRLVTSGKSG
jgi:hypothetical protein